MCEGLLVRPSQKGLTWGYVVILARYFQVKEAVTSTLKAEGQCDGLPRPCLVLVAVCSLCRRGRIHLTQPDPGARCT